MEEIEIAVNPAGREEQLTTLIEEAVAHFGLHVRMRSTLHSYPGSLHWHVQKPGERGTLEVTLWPAGKRCGSGYRLVVVQHGSWRSYRLSKRELKSNRLHRVQGCAMCQ
jgi:hypothetical protein